MRNGQDVPNQTPIQNADSIPTVNQTPVIYGSPSQLSFPMPPSSTKASFPSHSFSSSRFVQLLPRVIGEYVEADQPPLRNA